VDALGGCHPRSREGDPVPLLPGYGPPRPKPDRLKNYVRGSEVLVIGSGWCVPAT